MDIELNKFLLSMKDISKYWVKDFNWRKHESELNNFSNYTTSVDEIDIHFIHEKGSGSKATPLLLMHGWPGSIIEFFQIIEKYIRAFFLCCGAAIFCGCPVNP